MVPSSVSGDEARMLAEGLPGVPVLIGKRRQLSAAHAVDRFGVRACVLDDAFQYWRLVKHLDIVLIDARCPWGGGFLLPRGLLRESPRQLKRADAVIITNGHELSQAALAALRCQLHHLNSRAIVAEARHVPSGLRLLSGDWGGKDGSTRCDPLSIEGSPLAGCPVLALSSLGNPGGFEQMLSELGATVVSVRFPDHHDYRLEELTLVVGRAREAGCAAIITTDKDAVKLDPSWTGDFPVWVLSVELEFESGEDELLACLDAVVA